MGLKQIEPTECQVGGITFYITPFSAFKAANLTGELTAIIAPLIGILAPMATNKDVMDIDASKAGEALASCPAIDGDKIENVVKKLLLGGHIVFEYEDDEGNKDVKKLDMDWANELFCGEVQGMFALCFHVIKLNYNGFFKRLPSQSGRVESPARKQKKIL